MLKRPTAVLAAAAVLAVGLAAPAGAGPQIPGLPKSKPLTDLMKRADQLRDLVITEEEEIKLGASVSERVRARYGVVQNAAVHRYVTLVGTLLVRKSTRPALPYHFIVLDTVPYAIENVRKLIGKKPIFGICLGHQLLGLALGGKTFKLKFGHRGANQPVKDLKTGKVAITSQNHGFAVDPDSLNPKEVELTQINLNERTLEGMRHKTLPIFSVQYHPEASPGPQDTQDLFGEFVKMMEKEAKEIR